jgi:hypothetical protein
MPLAIRCHAVLPMQRFRTRHHDTQDPNSGTAQCRTFPSRLLAPMAGLSGPVTLPSVASDGGHEDEIVRHMGYRAHDVLGALKAG